MSVKKFLIAVGVLILAGVVLAACGGAVPVATATATEPPATATEPAVAATQPAATEPPAAVSPHPATVQFETCDGCHADTGSEHQKYYDMLYQDGVIKVEDVAYKFIPAAGDKTDTTQVSFKMTKDGQPISGASVENLNIYHTAYTGTGFEQKDGARLSLKGKLSYDEKTGVTTSTLAELPSTDKAFVDYTDQSKTDGLVVVYGYDKQVGSLPVRVKQVQFPFAGLGKTGKGTDYVSAANDSGCEKCHSDPYLKHGNIYGEVDNNAATDFYTCKACHLDNGEGGHLEWQITADDPEAGAAYLAAGEGAATPEQAAKYAYKTTLMNDVHMSHSMEFPYPQSMSNCVTCHEGKLDTVLSDANFKIATCKSCHPVTGSVKKDGDTVIYDTTQFALKTILPEAIHGKMDLETTDCTSCHGEGKSAPAFNQIHTGYDKSIYTADGKRISDIVSVSLDKAAFQDGKLTFSFSANSSEDIGLDPKTITPTVLVSLYGWNTKDFVVGGHERLIDDNKDGTVDSKDARNLELTLDGKSENPRVSVGTAANGKWEVTADLTPWQDLMDNGTVNKAEIAVLPALINQDEVPVAVNATSKTFDLAANKFVNFYPEVVKVKDGCNECHDALGTTFHSPSYGGSVTVCSMCHIVKSGASHLEMQGRTIDSYIHAIHNSQQFDVADIDFSDPAQAQKYATDSELPFPKHGITNCEACHNPGTYDVPSQAKTLAGITSASAELKGKTRDINNVPSYVTGPASLACGSCHRAGLINEDSAQGLTLFNQHVAEYGYMVEAGDKPLDTLNNVWSQIMGLFGN
jgi:OmcA/MtrC family decaheme c-type cytochrome